MIFCLRHLAIRPESTQANVYVSYIDRLPSIGHKCGISLHLRRRAYNQHPKSKITSNDNLTRVVAEWEAVLADDACDSTTRFNHEPKRDVFRDKQPLLLSDTEGNQILACLPACPIFIRH